MSVFERALKSLKTNGAPQRRVSPVASVVGKHGKPVVEDSTGNRVSIALRPERHVEFDLAALRRAGLYASGNERLADEYRIIKRPLLKKAREQNGISNERANLIMVASAIAGEGKTFTSVNLSMSLASEKDWQVLLVDVDCKNPQLSRLLGVRDEPGLLDFLREPAMTLDSVVLATSVERLNVLPLGTPSEDAAELLASARMSELCSSLASAEKHIVVFDSSPLLLTTEPVVLSSQVGQVVVVVNAYKTPQQAVEEAVEKLDESLAIGLILNRISPEEGVLRYGGYAYGSYPQTAE
jgi:protein-tyrosine kinase